MSVADSVPSLEIRLLGAFTATVGGTPLPALRTRKGQWLLALLALRSPRTVSREWLAATLWPESMEEQALAGLRRALTDLRQAMGPASDLLEAPTPRTLHLINRGTFIDVRAFDRAVEADDAAAAVSLYSGLLLEDCTEEWILPERAARHEAYLRCRSRLAEDAMQGQDFAAAAAHWRLLTTADPLRETAVRGWMESLAALGDFAAAIQVYREFRVRLRREWNAEPGPETTTLFQRLRHDAQNAGNPRHGNAIAAIVHPVRSAKDAETIATNSSVPGVFPHSFSAPRPPSVLPKPLTPFIGREREVRTAASALATGRLATLAGIGGIGKTRLSLAVAEYLLDREASGIVDGAFFVDFSAIRDAAAIARTVAGVVGVNEEPGRSMLATLSAALQSRHLLLVFDNCEHLLDDLAAFTQSVLTACPHVRILATSREPLRLPGETVLRVPPLSLPTEAEGDSVSRALCHEAVRLFVERAEAVRPDFRLTPENVGTVISLCERLEGIPLALEFAAARMSVLPLAGIASRLEDRFRLLTTGSRAAQPRQKTLRAALDWSYELLEENEQAFLRGLSVFVGGCSLTTARSICLPESEGEWETLDLMAALVDKSLVTMTEHGRYRLSETVREYGLCLLDESGERYAYQRRHAETFADWVRTAAEKMRSGAQTEGIESLVEEQDNIRAALPFLLSERDLVLNGQRVVHVMARFWTMRNALSEAARWCERGLAACPPDDDPFVAGQVRARLLAGAGVVARRAGDYDRSRCLQEESLAVSRTIGDDDGIATALGNLALLSDNQGDYERSQALREEGLALQRRRGDDYAVGMMLHNIGNLAQRLGDLPLARERFAEAITLRRQIGDTEGLAWSLIGLSNTLCDALRRRTALPDDRADLTRARTESEKLMRSLEDREGVIYCGVLHIREALDRFALDEAHDTLRATLDELATMEGNSMALEPLEICSQVAAAFGDAKNAARFSGTVDGVLDTQGTVITPAEQADRDAFNARLRATLGGMLFCEIYIAGRALPIEEAVAEARAWVAASSPVGSPVIRPAA